MPKKRNPYAPTREFLEKMIKTHGDKEILKIFGTANQYILLNLSDGFVAGVPPKDLYF